MKLTEDIIRKLTLDAIKELGDQSAPELVKEAVKESVRKLDLVPEDMNASDISSERVILTSFGVNSPGVIFNITKLRPWRHQYNDI